MTREEQDKNWNNLSQNSKEEMKAKYAVFSKKDTPESKGYCQGLAIALGEHNLQYSMTYEDLARELFEDGAWQVSNINQLIFQKMARVEHPFNFTSVAQIYKSAAINCLLNVAKYLNMNEDGSDWVPDWENEDSEFYTFGVDPTDNSVRIIPVNIERVPTEIVYFRTNEIIEQAIQILGEDTVRTALTTEY